MHIPCLRCIAWCLTLRDLSFPPWSVRWAQLARCTSLHQNGWANSWPPRGWAGAVRTSVISTLGNNWHGLIPHPKIEKWGSWKLVASEILLKNWKSWKLVASTDSLSRLPYHVMLTTQGSVGILTFCSKRRSPKEQGERNQAATQIYWSARPSPQMANDGS